MRRINYVQHTFSKGVISPLLSGRDDLAFYNKALTKAENVIVLPQGAITNRWGTTYANQFPEGDCIAKEYRTQDRKNYLIIFTDIKVRIYYNDVLQKTLPSVFTVDIINKGMIKTAKTLSGMVILGDGTVKPQLLKRGATDADWTLEDLSLKTPPSYDFKENYATYTFYLSSTSVGFSQLRCSHNIFDKNYVGGVFFAPGDKDEIVEGYLKIIGYIDARNLTVSIQQAFSDKLINGIKGSSCVLTENAFNDEYGYPTSITFFDNRLYMAATPSLPSTIFWTRINSSFDFTLGTGNEDEGGMATISENEIITNIVGDYSLQILTEEAEYSTIDDSASTTNKKIRKMGGFGSEFIQAVNMDEQTFFVRSKGSGIGSFSYRGGDSSDASVPISIFADHLINNPVCLGTYKGKDLTDSNYLFIVNEDGTLVVYQSLKIENISSFFSVNISNQAIDGQDTPKFKSVVPVGNDIYFIVEREVNNVKYNYIEKGNFDSNFDCASLQTFSTPVTEVSNLDFLEGHTVDIKVDGLLENNKVVSAGKITLDNEGLEVEVGLWSPSEIELLPNPTGTLFIKKRIYEIVVDYYETCPASLDINGSTFPEYQFNGTLPYPSPDELKTTSFFKSTNIDGWAERNTIQIIQHKPFDFNVISVCSKVGE